MLNELRKELVAMGFGIRTKTTDRDVVLRIAAMHEGRIILVAFPAANGREVAWISTHNEGAEPTDLVPQVESARKIAKEAVYALLHS